MISNEKQCSAIYLVGNVVGKPVKALIQTLTRGSTCALDVPEAVNIYIKQ
jgi:hypothetical protein